MTRGVPPNALAAWRQISLLSAETFATRYPSLAE
jgi:hypothetical protein